MTDFRPLELDPLHPKRHLRILQTPFGPRAVYDSVSFCTRCGSCQQTCPTYVLTSEETFSPRGRNQAARLVIEGKLNPAKNQELLSRIVNSCLLCGRCTQACAGKIPTAEHMLEMRRALNTRALPGLLHALLSWRSRRPGLFRFTVRAGLVLRQAGAARLLRLTGLTRLKSLAWINHADDILPTRTPLLAKRLRQEQIPAATQQTALIYLPSLEAEFFMPDLAASTLKTAAGKRGALVWQNTPSGLFEYVYGNVRQSRRLVKNLIRRREQTAGGKLPLLTDSADVYLFLRRAPQLFEGFPRWQRKAREFAANVRFITDFMPKKPVRAAEINTPVRLDPSALFLREGEPFDSARKTLKTLFKKNFVECLYKDADTPAFGYSFVRHNLAKRVCLNAVRNIARTQTGTVFTLSGLSALELDFYLKQFYPYARADHFARLNG